jgi:carbohydrate-binding DOMON domain-containing protein
MNRTGFRIALLTAIALAFAVAAASAQEVAFKDPVGDDKGPGKYTYPTDPVYKAGSFDLTELKFTVKGDRADVAVSVNSNLEDPWGMKVGFAVQMVFVFIQTDDAAGRTTKGLPGLNIQFGPDDGWNRCIILSPQPSARVRGEVEIKAPALQKMIVIPNQVRGSSRTISATVPMKDLGSGDPTKWGYQVVMQSNEGFPDKTDLLTRKVNEYEGQHRFGGGNDGDCDPHVMDILAGHGTGDKSEIEEQYKMLAYECNPDGTSKKMATLKMVRK